MKKWKVLLGTISLSLRLSLMASSSNSVSAARIKYRSTTPVSLRGTWYHYYAKKKFYVSHAYMDKITINKHSMTETYRGHVYRWRGKHFKVSYFNSPYHFKGHGIRHLNSYGFWDQGDTPTYEPTHFNIAGKNRPVMLETPQQGPFPIYTRFKPSKDYAITAIFK